MAYSQGDSYVTTDPAIQEMEMSLDMPRGPAPTGPVMIMPVTNTPAAANIPVQNIAGAWHLDLTDGESINLTLSQSGNVAFGRGSLASGSGSLWATASGFVSGSLLRLDVVPSSGSRLYAIALDLSGRTPAGMYSIFSSDGATSSGTIRWTRPVT
ncbi:MAG TPA: hypothetical protein VN455_03040 [Methanotrichaceae archaeon]|nr:hypothetical protein [Methanotrichaceae archaeon]